MRTEVEIENLREVSNIWYLVPFLFGILGGLIAYVATKDVDEGKASGFLALGFFFTIFNILIGWALMEAVMLG